MALQMGELEVRIKANVDDLKRDLQDIQNQDDIEINATVNVDDSELEDVLEEKHITITATDEASDTIDAVEENIDDMPDSSDTELTATDDASETIASVDEAAANLSDGESLLTAEDEASAIIDDVNEAAETISDGETTITATDDATATIEAVNEAAENITDGETTITATDDASETIEEIQSEVEAFSDEEITISALDDTAEGVESAISALDTIPEDVESEISVSADVDTSEIESTSIKLNIDLNDLSSKIGKAIKWAWEKVEGVFNFTVEMALNADDTATLATILGVSYQQLAALQFMQNQIDVSIETWRAGMRAVNSDMEKLQAAYENDANSWAQSTQYAALGGKYASPEEAWAELGTFGLEKAYINYIATQDQSQWEMLAKTLLGNQGTSFMPGILAAYNGTFDAYWAKYTDPNSIYGRAASEETAGALLDLSDSYANFNSAVDALKSLVAAFVAPVFTDSLTELTSAIEDLDKIWNDDSLTDEEKGKKIAERVGKALESVWNSISTWVTETLWPTIEPLVTTLLTALGELIKIGWAKMTASLPSSVKSVLGLGGELDTIGEDLYKDLAKKGTHTTSAGVTQDDRIQAINDTVAYIESAYGFSLNKEGKSFVYNTISGMNGEVAWWEVIRTFQDTDWTAFAKLPDVSEMLTDWHGEGIKIDTAAITTDTGKIITELEKDDPINITVSQSIKVEKTGTVVANPAKTEVENYNGKVSTDTQFFENAKLWSGQ